LAEPIVPPGVPVQTQSQKDRGAVAISALIFASGTFLSRILGLLRDMMTARYFTEDIRDAFIIAFRLPNLFRRLLGEGSLSISFIPVFVGLLQGNRKDEAHRLVNSVFAILMTISLTLSLLGILFMDDLLRWILSGEEFRSIAGKLEITIKLGRIMFGFLALMSAFAFFMAVLNSLKQFALSALAPCFLNIAMISAALISNRWAAPEEVLAWAVMIGGVLQMGLLVPSVIKAGYFPRPTLQWYTPEVRKVMRAILPSMFGMSIMQVTQIVNLHFASTLPKGSHSALYFADRVLELPLSMFVVSVGSALLPTLSRFHAANDRVAMADTINHYLRLILFVSLPAAVGMFLLAQPITEVLFMGNKFTLQDAMVVADVLQVYAFGLMVSSAVRILAQGFYAIQNTWYPALATSVAIVSHLVFAATLTKLFGLNGLAASTICSAAVNMTMLLVAYNKWVGHLDGKKLIKGLATFTVAAVVMGLVLQIYWPLLYALGSQRIPKTIALGITIGAGILVYFQVANLLRVPEYRETAATFKGKIGGKLARLRGKK
jgi:putative peptidoglycan lipid II flippase